MAATIQTIQKPTRARALDTSGSNNHGQIYSGRALEFDGVVDTMTTGYGLGLNPSTESITIAAWVYSDDVSQSKIYASFARDNDNRIYLAHNSSKWDFGLQDSAWTGSTNHVAGTTQSIAESKTWYRIVFVLDKSTLIGTMYANGVAGLSKTYTSFTTATALRISGTSTSSYLWDGMMSDVQVWNAAWTADDVTFDYNNPEQLALNRGGTSLTNSNLKAWYPMNDGHRGQHSYILDASNTGPVVELVTDGSLDTDIAVDTVGTNWTTKNGSSVTNGIATIYTHASNANSSISNLVANWSLYQDGVFSSTTGDVYKVSFDARITAEDGTAKLQMGNEYSIAWDGNQTESGLDDSGAALTSSFQTFSFIYHQVAARISASHDGLAFGVYPPVNRTSEFQVKNISIKAVNKKNHATTVFFGDELITSDYADNGTFTNDNGNWAVFGSDVAISTWSGTAGNGGDNGGLIVNPGSTSTAAQGVQLGTGYFETLVVGRTYRVTADIIGTSGGLADFQIGLGGATSANFNVTTSWATYNKDLVATSDAALTIANINADQDSDWKIDNISVKEVGTASGWTDADQQLDIPQTALQSYNQLAWFPGVDPGTDYDITISADSDINDIWDGGGTASAWIYPVDVGSTGGRIFTKTKWLLYMATGGTKLAYTFDHATSDASGVTTNAVLTVGEWAHVVMTYNDDNPATQPLIYVNGEEVAVTENSPEGEGSYVTDASYDLLIGNNTDGTRTFHGAITEVSLWTSVLTQAQVNELYNDGKALDATIHSASPSTGTDYLKGYWRNNGLATWQDLTANDNDGTVNNLTETMLISAGVDGSRDSQGFLMNRQRATNSLNLEDDMQDDIANTGSYMAALQSPLTADTDYNAMTVTLWFKVPDNTIRDSLFSIIYDDSTHFTVDTLGTGKLFWTYEGSTATTDVRYQTDADLYSSDKWTFVAFALDHDIGADVNRVKCYVGDEDTVVSLRTSDTTHMAVTTTPSNNNSMQIGFSNVNNTGFTGQVDDVCVYTKTLELPEITRNYNAGKRSHK